jgi:hypothetical protein
LCALVGQIKSLISSMQGATMKIIIVVVYISFGSLSIMFFLYCLSLTDRTNWLPWIVGSTSNIRRVTTHKMKYLIWNCAVNSENGWRKHYSLNLCLYKTTHGSQFSSLNICLAPLCPKENNKQFREQLKACLSTVQIYSSMYLLVLLVLYFIWFLTRYILR